MLFVTVYGPELESLFQYIYRHTLNEGSVSREQLYSAYLPQITLSQKGQTKNVEDAVNYLKSAKLIEGDKAYTSTIYSLDTNMPFSVLLLNQFRQLERIPSKLSLLDLLYVTLLEQLYIAPNQVWISDLHAAVNQLDLAQQIGGISQEKIGAWRRVMEFLGVGYRIGSGFYCLFQPEIVNTIVQRWSAKEGTLQEFFEEHLQSWIPCLTARGEIALPIAFTLEQLARDKQVHLTLKQDSPSRPYFGQRRLKGIEVL